jgi:hypothetical protein
MFLLSSRMNVPNGPGIPKRPPDQRQRPGCQRKISAHHRGVSPLEEILVSLASLVGFEAMGPQEPIVQMKIGGYPVDFMVDTEMKHSLVTQPVGPLSKSHTTIIRAQGTRSTTPSYWLDDAILKVMK